MSALTINKLKKHLRINNTLQENSLTQETQPYNNQPALSSGGLESTHLFAVMNQCGFTIVKGKTVPASKSKMPAPISPEIAPASSTTRQLISATILAAASPTDPTTRFLDFFPPPIPPPQFLQPDFVKYNISYGPKYSAKPCIGFREILP